jgi:Tfp pilus assembly protein PilX
MKGLNQVHRGQQGSILIVVLGFLFITIGLVITILSVASNARKVSQKQMDMEQAMFVAEGGLERGARFMQSNLNVIVSSATGTTNGSGNIGSGSYSFYIARSNASSSTYFIVSTGTVSSVSRVCSLLNVYQPTYAEFALWSDTNGAIYFVNGEVFNGHVHANDMLYFDATSGGPIFHAAVTSDAGTYSIQGGSIGSIEFDQGLTLNSFQGQMADVDFSSASSKSLKNTASTSGLLLTGPTTITFNGGTMNIVNSAAGWGAGHSYTPSAEGIIYVANISAASSGTVYFAGGHVTGRLTVASEADMTIGGAITYTTDPRTNPNSTDALGLVSKADVWVGTAAPNNLEIDAAIMATSASSSSSDAGSFGVINYSSGTARGTLTIYGGIVQEVRGAVGTAGGTPHGFSKNYSYDSRFLSTPPPYYPTVSNQVSFARWTEGH